MLAQQDVQLFGSAGNSIASAGAVQVSYSIGEAIMFTSDYNTTGNNYTQGFQQPTDDDPFPSIILSITKTNVRCKGEKDGSIIVAATGGSGSYTYSWNNGKLTPAIDSLVAGTYFVKVMDTNGDSAKATVTLIEQPGDCNDINTYKGFTPNGDNINDSWTLARITEYANNTVTIFNRWGDEVWSGSNYDNVNVVWRGENKSGNTVPVGTYFYVINYGEKTSKGWVEVSR